MYQSKATGCSLLTLILSSLILTTVAYPNAVKYQQQQIATQQQANYPQPNYVPLNGEQQGVALQEDTRKFAEKPNNIKKVALDDIDDDLQTNQIQDTNGFSWSNMLGTLMAGQNSSFQNIASSLLQMFFNPGGGGGVTGPTKSDAIDADVGGYQTSPWANIISIGLRIFTTLLGGGANNDGIDKVDNGNSPMQGILAAVLSGVLGTRDPEQVNTMAKQAGEFISIMINLLDALKTSFSHRSLTARSVGKKDSVSDAAVAGISMVKSYVRTYRNTDDKCMQKYLCEANSECTKDIGGSSIFCQLGTYATSFFLERTVGGAFESFYEAGRKGRSTGVDCRQIYLECNEV